MNMRKGGGFVPTWESPKRRLDSTHRQIYLRRPTGRILPIKALGLHPKIRISHPHENRRE